MAGHAYWPGMSISIAPLAILLPLLGTAPQASELPALPAVQAPDASSPFALPPLAENRRTLPNFFSNTGRGITGVWSGHSVAPLLIGLAGASAAHFGDGSTERYFESHPMARLGRAGAASGSSALVAGTSIAMLGLSQGVGNGRFRAAAYDTSEVILVNGLYTFALKSATGRTRPDGSDSLSFPSGHTSNAFAIATVWSKQYGAKAAVPGYLLAGLVGVSRMATQRHHLSDVVAGAALGYLTGSSVSRANGGRVGAVHDGRRLSFGLDSGPSGDGVGLALQLNLSRR